MPDDDDNIAKEFPGFVCVQNRNRDHYEVPLALAEAGLLERLVTDFYAAERDRRWLPGPLARRHRDALTASRTRNAIASFLVQSLGAAMRLPMHRVFAVSDRLLGKAALRLARSRGAGLYAYSSYMPADPDLGPRQPVIDFEYHPHPGLSLEILAADHARYPQTAWSFALERKIAARQQGPDAWRKADAVVCASAMTRRSLEHAGCPAERITVIPYGIAPDSGAAGARPKGPCRFLFVGQGIQRKGLHHLALAWREAGLANAELVVVAYRIDPGIAAMLDQPGIRLLGRQSKAELVQLFRQADAFVMPSLVEGFGLVYLEALQAGCHVVGTGNTGLPDLNLPAHAATILDPGDIFALAASLHSLAQRKAADDFDPAAISGATAHWTWENFRSDIARHADRIARQAGALAAARSIG